MPSLREIQERSKKLREGNDHPTPEADMLRQTWELLIGLKEANHIELRTLPGCWVYTVDENWKIKVNGHKEEIDGVPPFSVWLEWNGWPAGIINPTGGLVAAGQAANLETLNLALTAAYVRDRAESKE